MKKNRRAIAALGLTAVGLALAACSSGGDDGAGGGGGAEAPRAVEVDDGGSGAGDGERAGRGQADVAKAAEPSRLPALGPRVIHTASLLLTVPRDGFEDAVERARTVASGLGGFVVGSSASQAGRGRLVRGSLVVRVPARTYARAMASLAAIGRVEGREESGEDVSQEFVDLEARARHLEAVERQLLELLDRARTVPAALAVQSQLNETQLELEQARGRLRFLENQTSFATITLSLRERLPAAGPSDGGWGIVEAWTDAGQAFSAVAGRIFVVLAGAAPVLVLVGLFLAGVRLLRRKPLFHG